MDIRKGFKMRYIGIFLTVIAFVGLGMFTIHQANEKKALQRELESKYEKAFYEMVGYVSNVDALLVKSMVAGTPDKASDYFEETWRNVTLAQTVMNELPLSQNVFDGMSKFLIQVGDFAYSLSIQNSKGQPISEKQYDSLENMQKYAESLNATLNEIMADIAEGNMVWSEMKEADEETENLKINNLVKTFVDYPTLIYDGPFSDHIPEIEPKGLTGKEITRDEASRRVETFFKNDKIERVEFDSETDDEVVNVYRFKVSFEDSAKEAYVDVTKKGGHFYWALKNREIDVCKISVNEAIRLGAQFLGQMGFNNIKDSYYTNENGIATIDYIYYDNEVKYYPDMLKVRVALDNGEILGFDSKRYVYNHSERVKPEPEINLEKARTYVNKNIEISSENLAMIPTEFKTEVLVYEFTGRINERDILVYINAETGREENILIILDTDQGILTQ